MLALGNLHGLFYRKFALSYLQKIVDLSMQNVLESPESNFRNFNKDKIEGVINGLEKIIKRLYPAKERFEVLNTNYWWWDLKIIILGDRELYAESGSVML